MPITGDQIVLIEEAEEKEVEAEKKINWLAVVVIMAIIAVVAVIVTRRKAS